MIALCSPQLVTFHVSHRTRTRRPWKITAVAFNAMLDRALEEANVAYAPYSTSPAGLAFGTYEGNIFSGRSLESAAFSPSLSRLHTALTAYVQSSAGLQRDLWSDITGVALVEVCWYCGDTASFSCARCRAHHRQWNNRKFTRCLLRSALC